MAVAPLLEVRGLSKAFGGSQALDDVDFEVRPGEIHALLGENGAGKSTLIKVLAGVYRPDVGKITFDGRSVSPWVDRRLPISFVHQDLGLVETMTVAENIALVSGYRRRGGLISWPDVVHAAHDVLKVMGADIDPNLPVSTLSAADKSIVAIARGLGVDARLLVLDEPTAALPASDVARLFDILKTLRTNGIGMIYVTHRLDEVVRLADRVTVLRDGRKIATREIAETDPSELVFLIVGRRLSEVFPPPPADQQEPVLALDSVEVGSVGPVSFLLHAGEIVGLVGLRGAGHHSVGRMISGDLRLTAGSARFMGQEIGSSGCRDCVRRGIGFVTSKRAEEGLATSLAVRENVFLNPVGAGTPFARLSPRRERQRTLGVLERFDIRPRHPERLIATLSGGNQQKVLLARAIELDSRLLVLEEPTFGVDVGAKADIYAKLMQGLKDGRAALIVSSDFEEVARVCERALVFDRGRVVAAVAQAELTTTRLTELATGAFERAPEPAT